MKKTQIIIKMLLLCFSLHSLSEISLSQENIFGRRVLIGFKDGTGKNAATNRRHWISNMGGDVHYSFHIVPIVAARLPEELIAQLKNYAEITYIEDDIIMRANQQEISWGVDRIDADLVWGTTTGIGVDVAVLDTGLDFDHPDLISNIAGGVNFAGWWWVDGSTLHYYWDDRNGHGSHCAGIVAAANNSIGIVGVAPKARLWAVKVLSDNGIGYASDTIQGLEWCADNGIEIVSMSFSGGYSESLKNACNAAYAAGVLLVTSAGNGCGGAVNYPAGYDSVIAVSATNESDAIADFSSIGPAVELAAPGVNIQSTYRNGSYAVGSGTSMACPHVTGVAALIWSNPELGITTAAEVRNRLQTTAEDLGAAGRDIYFGYGLVDAQAAAEANSEPPVLTTIEVSPSAVTLFEGETQQFSAAGTDQYGAPIDTGTITWQSSNTSVGTISPAGLFTATSEGTTTISATSGSVIGHADVTVNEVPVLTTVEVSPSAVTLFVDETQQFTASGTDQYGGSISTGSVTWQSSNTTVGTISPAGLFTAASEGTATISATSGSVVGYANVTVQEAPVLTTIEVTPANVMLDVGQTQQFTAAGKDQYDDPIDTGNITWESSNESAGTVDSTGLFEALAEGTTNVRAISGQIVGIAGVTVQEAPAIPAMHVGDITFDVNVWSLGPWFALVQVTVIVSILDSSDSAVTEATVSGSWSGAYNRSVSGTTNNQGNFTFNTGWFFGGGTFTFTVNDVTKEEWIYDSSANIETSDSITAP